MIFNCIQWFFHRRLKLSRKISQPESHQSSLKKKESGSDKSIVGPSRSDKRNQDCSETSKRVLPTVGPGEAGIGEAEGGPAPMFLFSLFFMMNFYRMRNTHFFLQGKECL